MKDKDTSLLMEAYSKMQKESNIYNSLARQNEPSEADDLQTVKVKVEELAKVVDDILTRIENDDSRGSRDLRSKLRSIMIEIPRIREDLIS